MTALAYKLATPGVKSLLCNRSAALSNCGYIVPTHHVRQLLEAHADTLNAEFNGTPTSLLEDDAVGWRKLLAGRIANILGVSDHAAVRRIWGILSGESHITRASWVDAACIALDLQLDHDVVVPILPGTINLTRELLTERAAAAGVELDHDELERLVKYTFRLTRLILYYPHHEERLLKLAPFNCFLPYER